MVLHKMYAVKQAALYEFPNLRSKKVGYVSSGDVLLPTGSPEGDFAPVLWNNTNGYAVSASLEQFTNVFPPFSVYVQNGPEVRDAEKAGRPSQYISLRTLGTSYRSMNYNLCGEFCAASLLEMGIMEFLFAWVKNVQRARTILAGDKTTGMDDLESMLSVRNATGKRMAIWSTIRGAPSDIAAVLPAIIGVGINAQGRVRRTGSIRHWVVLHRILMQANGAWALIYNPFWNREETVLFDDLAMSGTILAKISREVQV